MIETIHLNEIHHCQCGLETIKRYRIVKTGQILWLCFLCTKNYQINELEEVD
jgi:hypothetical protein